MYMMVRMKELGINGAKVKVKRYLSTKRPTNK